MRLASPYALLLLLFVPVFLYLRQRRRSSVAVRFSSIPALAPLSPPLARSLPWVFPGLRPLALLLCILALPRPHRASRLSRSPVKALPSSWPWIFLAVWRPWICRLMDARAVVWTRSSRHFAALSGVAKTSLGATGTSLAW